MDASGTETRTYRGRLVVLPLAGSLVVVLLAGCGGRTRALGDGDWYGKLVSVDVARREITFAPACDFADRRWTTAHRDERVVLPLADRPRLMVHFRPGGSAVSGHGQPATLRLLARVAAHGHLPDFPPGWYVMVRRGKAALVQEDSGLESTGTADRATFACIWSARTKGLVRG